jgi:hypothetical protein
MPSALDTARQLIEQHIVDNYSASPVQFEADDFRPPDGPWSRITLLWGEGAPESMGTTGVGTNIIVGVLQFDHFDKPDAGTGVITRNADASRDLFNRNELTSGGVVVRFDVPSGPTPGVGPDRDRWQNKLVRVTFTVEETI